MTARVRIRPAGAAVVLLACASAALPARGADGETPEARLDRGRELFESVCADCHGALGEGVEFAYDSPLHGDLPVGRLADYIDETMPEGSPEDVTGDDAVTLAEYLHGSFYTRAARIKNAPPRAELARLTGEQFRRSVAALGAAFTGDNDFNKLAAGPRGLDAEYRSRKGDWKNRLAFERLDPAIDLTVPEGEVPAPGEGVASGPGLETMTEDGFQIFWRGILVPPVTGEYTFVADCTDAVGLTINGRRLVDVNVRSGEETRHAAKLFLLGGRPVPLVMSADKRTGERFGKTPAEQAFHARLLWTVPRRGEEVVPGRHLLPGWCPETLLVSTPFPPDDRSTGYERGTAVSAAWDEATTEAAFETAERLLDSEAGVREFLKIREKDDADAQTEKAREFAEEWAERAFRRPLTDEQRALYVDAHFGPDETGAPRPWRDAVKRVVLMTLKSPHFLYPNLHAAIAAARGEAPDGYDRAASLALSLWDGLPDDRLRKDAAEGRLADPSQVAMHADRMARDWRADAKLADFFADWLVPEGIAEMAKDEGLYPGFDAAAAADLQTSLELTIAETLASEKADFRALWNADSLYLNARLAGFYGDDLADLSRVPADGSFAKLAVKPGRRAGLLTHPLLMAGYAHHRVTSPIHRGVFVARKLLGRALKPPKSAFTLLPEDFGEDMTTRERVAHQTGDASCMVCHQTINPLGFSLEQFDAIGRFRTDERTPKAVRPVDAAAVYETTAGEAVTMTGAGDLSRFLADSPEAHAAFVERLFHHAVKQPTAAYGLATRDELLKRFAESGYDIRGAFAAAAAAAALGPPAPAALADARPADAAGAN